ncbi:hypothetical protein AB0M46_17660 [Dactylosporangium sp. NPDC051485]|uniref:hypothetical protein n=1 Tax=Dactylosporangium sp. NPDC051485 TaxID=3154846 RepID=UPI003440F9F5
MHDRPGAGTILGEATGADPAACAEALAAAGGDLRTALVVLLTGVTSQEARPRWRPPVEASGR